MNYTTSIKVNARKEDAFEAITSELDKWWGKVDNQGTQKGDEFAVSFGKTKWRFVVTKYSKYNQINWRCINASHYVDGFTNIEEEWLNTELFWNFKRKDGYVEVYLEHRGLTPSLNCYTICESGWNFFITKSLKNYLETGKGNPRIE